MAPPARMSRSLSSPPTIIHQGQGNTCGPFSLAMAASCLLGRPISPELTAAILRPFRVPWLGATLPWGISFAAGRLGLTASPHWLGQPDDLKRLVDADRLAMTIVHPDDWPGVAWHALHYRIVVGYLDDPALAGGGELYFACSGTHRESLDGGRPGNVVVSYSRFRAQWHTYLTPRWYCELGGPRNRRVAR